MGLSREHVVALVNDACGWTDLQPDSLERMEAYDQVETKIKRYMEAKLQEEDVASQVASLAEELADFGIDVEADL